MDIDLQTMTFSLCAAKVSSDCPDPTKSTYVSSTQILELYINQIYLGQRAYGFSAASNIYYGKALKEISIAEAAMLAGLPKAPSRFNPVVNPKRAQLRQRYVLRRMHELGFINEAQWKTAQAEPLHVKRDVNDFGVHAEHVAEMARQITAEQFPDDVYSRGLRRASRK